MGREPPPFVSPRDVLVHVEGQLPHRLGQHRGRRVSIEPDPAARLASENVETISGLSTRMRIPHLVALGAAGWEDKARVVIGWHGTSHPQR